MKDITLLGKIRMKPLGFHYRIMTEMIEQAEC